jgi:GcrA cell cycle regulator
MKTGDFKWTQESIDKILQMYKHGDSASQIATALGNGLTRNAIIGKLNRLRDKGLRPELALSVISFKKTQGQKINKANAAKMATAYLAKPKAVLFQFPKPIPKPKLLQEVIVVQEPTGEHAAVLANLRPRGCKWIVEDFDSSQASEALMCGETQSGKSSYCEHHRRMGLTTLSAARIAASDRGLRRLGVWATNKVYGF